MGGVVALVLLVALFGFAVWRVVMSWRTTSRVWNDGGGGQERGEEGP
jgi:O-antigen ligase